MHQYGLLTEVTPLSNIRLSHFDYLKEDQDDEFKRLKPQEQIAERTEKFVESTCSEDRFACEDTLEEESRDKQFQEKHTPEVLWSNLVYF